MVGPVFTAAICGRLPPIWGDPGGIGPLLVSTFVLVSLAVILAALVSLPAAVIYTEKLGPKGFNRAVRLLLDVGLGLPRIVWGLFGSIFLRRPLGFWFFPYHGNFNPGLFIGTHSGHGFHSRNRGGGSRASATVPSPWRFRLGGPLDPGDSSGPARLYRCHCSGRRAGAVAMPPPYCLLPVWPPVCLNLSSIVPLLWRCSSSLFCPRFLEGSPPLIPPLPSCSESPCSFN